MTTKRRSTSSEYFPRLSVARRMITDEAVEQMRAQAEAMYRKPSASEPDPTLESAREGQPPKSPRPEVPIVEISDSEHAPSPWANKPADEVRASALPSSLRPHEEPTADDDPGPSVKPAGMKSGGHNKIAAAVGLATFVLVVVLGARALRTPETGPRGAASVVTPTTAAPTVSAAPTPSAPASVESQAPSLTSAAGSVEAAPVPTPRPAPAVPQIAPRPMPRGVVDDPYNGSAPSPAVTVAPTATPSATVAPTTSSTPTAPPKAPIEDPVEGPRVFGK